MAADLDTVAGLLQASLDANQSRQAEQQLRALETSPNFSLTLLQLIAADSLPSTTRLAAALFFKNHIRRNWVDENGSHILPANEVSTIKSELIGLMVRVPPSIQAQLGDAISVIADSDFWQRWDTLVDDLVSRLTPDDAQVNIGVLSVAHSIFKRWEPLYRSDELYTEINHVLERFAGPFLQLWQNTDQAITSNEGNAQGLRAQFGTLDLILKLMYDLSTHDMPPQFEEHLEVIAGLLHKYLTYDNAALRTEDEDEAGPQEVVKADVFRVLVLYTKKYEEEFARHMDQFIGTSWNLLTNLGPQPKNDAVVSRALEFLTIAVGMSKYASQFNNADVLGQVTENVVIPNLSLRESDIETFEDEPIEFIRRDLEGSDEDTRRRGATNFLRKLMEQFEKLVTDVVMRYVETFLSQYVADRRSNWKAKDTAVHLYSSIAAKGTATSAKGVVTVNSNVDVLSFFQSHIAQDLTNADAHPLLKVDAIKYLYLFRSILSAEQWQAAFPLLVQHLDNANYVVYTYAAIAVDRALYLTNDQRQPLIPRENIIPLSKDLLQHLFKLITKDTKPEKVQENEFLIKCCMRVLLTIREAVVQIMDMVLTNLVNITRVIRHNPSNPGFCYFHFESLGAVIRFTGPTQPEKLESTLFGPLTEILGADVDEFKPYIFQLLAALVATNPNPTVSPTMSALIAPVLSPTIWESRGNVPALARFLTAVLPKAAPAIVEQGQTEQVLILFQKLIGSKAHESHAMDILESAILSFPQPALETYWPTILQLLFHRLSNSKTEGLTLRFIRFYHLVSALGSAKGYGADYFIAQSDKIQENVFTPIYTQIILPDTQKLSRPTDRKTAVISLTRSLADSEAFATRYAKRGWTITCQALLQLLVNPPLPQKGEDVVEERDTEDLAFGSAFTPLNTCRPVVSDPFPEVVDVRAWAGKELREGDQRHGGRVGRFVQEKLGQEERSALGAVMG